MASGSTAVPRALPRGKAGCSAPRPINLGRFARDASPTYVVSFEGDSVRIAGDVRFEEIVLVDDLRGSAA